jgi:hypothetical protein
MSGINTENFSTATPTFGSNNGLSDLITKGAGDNSIRVVDLFTPQQTTPEAKLKAEKDESLFGSSAVPNAQTAAVANRNLDTSQYGVVGKGAAKGRPEWEGDKGTDYKGLTKSVAETKKEIYAQLDVKLDGIYGKGNWEKPTGTAGEIHRAYCQRLAEAEKGMTTQQTAQFRNDCEKIGQPFKWNFGKSRPREDADGYKTKVALNTCMTGAHTAEQGIEKTNSLNEFLVAKAAYDAARRKGQK